MSTRIEKLLDKMLDEGVYTATDELILDKEYKTLLMNYDKIIRELRNMLPEREKKLISEMETAASELSTHSEISCYRKGFKDGIGLSQIVRG